MQALRKYDVRQENEHIYAVGHPAQHKPTWRHSSEAHGVMGLRWS
jgi:hypothetical protein